MKSSPTPQALPLELRTQLRALRTHLWRVKILEVVSVVVLALLGLFLIVFLTDRIGNTPGSWRFGGLALWGSAALAAFAWTATYWVIRHRRWLVLGRFVQRWDRRSGDRLLAAIELAEGTGTLSESPELREAAIRQLSRQLGESSLDQSVDVRTVKRFGLAAVILTGVVIVLWGMAPGASLSAAQRLFTPWRDVERYTFAKIEPLPDEIIVAHDEPATLSVSLNRDATWKPKIAKLRIHPQRKSLQAVKENDAYHFNLPPLRTPAETQVAVGDQRTSLSIKPVHRPGLTKLEGKVTLPAYLKLPDREMDLTAGKAGLVPGSRLSLTGTVTRELANASLSGRLDVPFTIEGAHFQVSGLEVNTQTEVYPLTWTDSLGLSSKESFDLRITPREDATPQVVIDAGVTSPIAVLESDMIMLAVRASDDFGLREIGFLWTAGGGSDEPEEGWVNHQPLRNGQPADEELGADVAFAPSKLGLEPQVWRVFAYALDYLPNRAPVFSPPLTVQVLSPAEHAALLQSQFRQVQEQLEEVAREESALMQRNEELAAEELDSDQLAEQRQAELENAQSLEKLTEQAKDVFQKALKNESVDAAALAPFADMLGAMQEAASQGMPSVANSLGNAQAQANTPDGQGKAKKSLEEAIAKQKEVLEKLAAAMNQGQRAEEQMEAGTFVNRFRQVADEEQSVAVHMQGTMRDTLGLTREALKAGDAQLLDELSNRQSDLREQVGFLQTDLEAYFRRTGKPVYQEVSQLMQEASVVPGLGAITSRIATNQHGRVVRQALAWAETFHRWADILAEKPDDQESPTEGDDSDEAGEPDTNLAMTLGLMRLVQREMTLRDETRTLHAMRETHADYAGAAAKLAFSQWDIGKDVANLLAQAFNPGIQKRLRNAVKGISDAGQLLEKKETGPETIAAETEVIEVLAEAAKNSGEAGGNASSMEALEEMLAEMQIGNRPGGNAMGGASSLVGAAFDGESVTDGREERTVDKTTGNVEGKIPEEFREVLTSFFEQRDALLEAAEQ